MGLHAQSAAKLEMAQTISAPDGSQTRLEQKLSDISSALAETEKQLEDSQQQVHRLQSELLEIQRQLAANKLASGASSSSDAVVAAPPEVADLAERQEVLEAQVKLHDQVKVESVSKYPVRLKGLILFNAFLNAGVVDNVDLPEIALPVVYGITNRSAGAGLRQTILGIEGSGPKIWGAQTSAEVSLDFFAGLAYSNYGTSAGVVRMRTASINFDWPASKVKAGLVTPLISPLSPTSYATVAAPGMAGAGNLWTWAPQLSVEHKTSVAGGGNVRFQLGLWDPPAAGYSTNGIYRAPSPGEHSFEPAYEGRVSYGSGKEGGGLQVGVGGYYGRQSYPGEKTVDSWAATADWRLPIHSWFELSGEAYRGKSLGGLGGGVYKDVLTGTDPITGASVLRGLNTAGGWTQLKTRFKQTFEMNAAIGQDSGFASDFHTLILDPANVTLLRARNRMVVGNLIYSPKTYLILSPEFRRIWSWPITGPGTSANVFTFTFGYQF